MGASCIEAGRRHQLHETMVGSGLSLIRPSFVLVLVLVLVLDGATPSAMFGGMEIVARPS